MNISNITAKNIRNWWLQKDLPEFYALQNVPEHNDAHEESTFEHTLHVLDIFEDNNTSLIQEQRAYLDKKVDENSMRDLIKLIILFHDIGKAETLIMTDDGKTKFPWHEEKSFEKITPLLDKFSLTQQEKGIIENIIRYHWLLHNILIKRETDDKIRDKAKAVKNEHPDIFFDLVFFDLLDTLSLHKMEQNNEKEYNFRINFFETLLKSL